MIKKIQKIVLASALLVGSHTALYSSAIEGTSESISAGLEAPNFEGQLTRINLGINFVRLNTDIMSLPIAADSQWPAKLTGEVPSDMKYYDIIKYDAYYSTVALTNAKLGRGGVMISPLTQRMFYQTTVLYKNPEHSKSEGVKEGVIEKEKGKGYYPNGDLDPNWSKRFHVPNMNALPSLDSMQSFVTFPADDNVAIIEVESAKATRYANVKEAVFALLPEDLLEDMKATDKELDDARSVVEEKKAELLSVEAWLDDDKNSGSPETADKKASIEGLEAALEVAEKEADAIEEIYETKMQSAAVAIESDIDKTKIPLAKNVKLLLEAVKANSFGALSMFTSATIGLVRGFGQVTKELQAINSAKMGANIGSAIGLESLGWKSPAAALAERESRMLFGAIFAIPNIGIGTYKAMTQSSDVGVYLDIAEAVLSGEEEVSKEAPQK